MAHIYVSQSGAGTQDGSNCANAHSLSWFNTAGNWGGGAGEINPGDTVHFCGTFTGQAIPQASGTAGNYITLLFETGANFTTTVWPSDGAIAFNSSKQYFIVDGGVNGLIRNTDCGTSPTYGSQANSRGIGGSESGAASLSHAIIRNLTISDIYKNVLNPVPASRDQTRSGYCIDLVGTDLLIENNAVSDGDGLISVAAASNSSDIIIQNNTILRYNHGVVIGVGDLNVTMANLTIRGNFFNNSAQYDGPPGGDRHLDGIIILNNGHSPTSRLENVRIYENWFGPLVGTVTTAAIFNSMQSPMLQCEDWYIFNNVFECDPTYNWGNGFIAAMAVNMNIFNNTAWGQISPAAGGGIFGGGGPAIIKNNIIRTGAGINAISSTGDTVPQSSTGAATQSVLTNYYANWYSNRNIIIGALPAFAVLLAEDSTNNYQWVSGQIEELTNWQTWYNNNRGMDLPIWNTAHADPNSTTTAPTFDPGTYVPAAGDTQARGQGENLTAIFTEMGIPATDYYGNARPAVGNWTIGAFEGDDAPPVITTLVVANLIIG